MANLLDTRSEIAAAINQICEERNIEPEIVANSIKVALVASYNRDYEAEYNKIVEDQGDVIEADFDIVTGEFKLYTGKVGDPVSKMKDITPPGFGRIAAQTAKQVVLQKIREAEKDATISLYRDRVGDLINAMVLRTDKGNIIFDLGRGQAVMPPEDQVRGEFYRLNSRFAVLISDIRETYRGETIIASRTDPRLVAKIFEREVPEVSSGAVVIKSIAREPGSRTKIAFASTQDGVDPVGSCVGQKGVRVQAVINELNGEKIDIIPYSDDLSDYIRSALSPAEGIRVEISKDKTEAIVTVPADQLSLAIGRGGQNVRLAAKLVKIAINIKSDQDNVSLTITGDEEYEIDQLDLTSKVRQALISAKLIRIDSLTYTLEEGKEIKGLTDKNIKDLTKKIAIYKPPKRDEEKEEEAKEEIKEEPEKKEKKKAKKVKKIKKKSKPKEKHES